VRSDLTDASAPFNLGNILRRVGRNVEAEAALRTATRVDQTFAEAWYNLGDLLDEQTLRTCHRMYCEKRTGRGIRRCNVQPRTAAATKKANTMGHTDAPIIEIL
jgi:tetratricopeptide (TPR) repeat protein